MKRAALIVAALATAGAWADTNLVVNGSFELGNFSPWGYDSATELVGTSDISGWTVINNSAAWIGGGNPWGLAAPDGSKFLDLTEFRSSGTLAAVRQTIATVPGALEAPLTLQVMARSGRFDALVALGAVIRGETYHFELVSNEQGAGITRVALDTGVPVANGILTTEDDDQALARMQVKGADCAQAAVEMARLLKALA